MLKKYKISVIGLGYVGLPLAVALSSYHEVIGFDVNSDRVSQIQSNEDITGELDYFTLANSKLKVTSNLIDIYKSEVFIITVPTPIDETRKPKLDAVFDATLKVGEALKAGDIVVYESTVYPGVTEDECGPMLEEISGLKCGKDFYLGYSPERINPGDKERTVEKILKVTSGSTPEIGKKVNSLYKSVITAGTYLAPTIKVAEASKVIENSQRDINIAFVNELAKIFNLLDINTHDVLEAAGTKWNFLPFKPGLVGGHCIGVDPYYLAQKAQENGYHPEIILAGRRLNDGMGHYVASQIVKCMIQKSIPINNADIIILGITFKENCPDVRNTKVVDLISALKEYGTNITIYDPWADEKEVLNEYGLTSLKTLPNQKFDAVVLTVSHNEFTRLDFPSIKNNTAIVYDVKNLIDNHQVDGRL